MQNDVVRLGIIGIGTMGGDHALKIQNGAVPGLELVAVADISDKRREWAQEHLSGVKIFEDGSDLIRAKVCDAVLIATPHYAHPTLAIEAFKHGHHVMVEKPAGVIASTVRELNRVAAESGKVFAVMYNQRTNCVYRTIKDMLSSGKYGAIRRMNWIITDWFRTQFYYDAGSWRATWDGEGGGVLVNQCPHQLDLLQWLCGMPVKVRAFCHEGKWHEIEVEDDVTAYLEFENGATGVFITTTGDTPGTNRLEITLDQAKIVCENDQIHLWELETATSTFLKESPNAFKKPQTTYSLVETDGDNPQHMGVLKAFTANILHAEPLVADGSEGINMVLLANAMHLSSWTGSTVTMPMDEDLFEKLLGERRKLTRAKEIKETTFESDHRQTK